MGIFDFFSDTSKPEFVPVDQVSVIIKPTRRTSSSNIIFYDLSGNRVPKIPKGKRDISTKFKCYLGLKKYKNTQRWEPVDPIEVENKIDDDNFIPNHSIQKETLKSEEKSDEKSENNKSSIIPTDDPWRIKSICDTQKKVNKTSRKMGFSNIKVYEYSRDLVYDGNDELRPYHKNTWTNKSRQKQKENTINRINKFNGSNKSNLTKFFKNNLVKDNSQFQRYLECFERNKSKLDYPKEFIDSFYSLLIKYDFLVYRSLEESVKSCMEKFIYDYFNGSGLVSEEKVDYYSNLKFISSFVKGDIKFDLKKEHLERHNSLIEIDSSLYKLQLPDLLVEPWNSGIENEVIFNVSEDFYLVIIDKKIFSIKFSQYFTPFIVKEINEVNDIINNYFSRENSKNPKSIDENIRNIYDQIFHIPSDKYDLERLSFSKLKNKENFSVIDFRDNYWFYKSLREFIFYSSFYEDLKQTNKNLVKNKLNPVISELDKDGNGSVDVTEGEDFMNLFRKHQKLIINVDRSYVQKFVKVSSYLNTKKENIQSLFNLLKKDTKLLKFDEHLGVLKNQIHTYESLLFHSLNMISSLIDDDMITFYEIYESFDKLGIFNSNWENEVSGKLKEIDENISKVNQGMVNLMYSINEVGNKISRQISNLTYVTQGSFKSLTETLQTELKSIDSSIKVNNLYSLISTYQLYKINKQTKPLLPDS